jgi:thiol peroxidase
MENSNDAVRTTTLKGNPFRLEGPELKPGDTAPDFEAVDASLQKMNLEKTGKGVRIFSVVPSLDTPVCDAQTRRFEQEAGKMSDVRIFTISMDLPFAQKRWCGNFGINKVEMISDHRSGSFGEHYGTLIPDLRIESRAIFVVDSDNKLRHVEYVREVGDHPNYESALNAAKAATGQGTAQPANV